MSSSVRKRSRSAGADANVLPPRRAVSAGSDDGRSPTASAIGWKCVVERHGVVPDFVGLDRVEPDADEHLGAAEPVTDHRVARHTGAYAKEERMIFGEDAFGLRRHEDRRAEGFS